MAVPHYAYLKLRMPANKGPLTISGSFARSENCDKDFNSMSQTFGVHEELNHVRESTNMDVDPLAQQNVIRPFCITILYHNLLLFIDIFHI
jgi:hypothetical protein